MRFDTWRENNNDFISPLCLYLPLLLKTTPQGVVPGPLFSVIRSFCLFLEKAASHDSCNDAGEAHQFLPCTLRFGKLEVCPPSFAGLAYHTCLLTLATVAGVLLSLSQCVAGSLCETSEAAEQSRLHYVLKVVRAGCGILGRSPCLTAQAFSFHALETLLL